MKTLTMMGLALLVVVGLVGTAAASEKTVDGSIMCAKCKLKKADATECQDVLVAKDGSGATTEYYIAKNDVSSKFGHTCQGDQAAIVTGEVTEKDGKMWITPSKMEKKG